MRVASVRHTCNIIYLLLLRRLERVTQQTKFGYTGGDIQQKRQTKQFPVKLEIKKKKKKPERNFLVVS